MTAKSQPKIRQVSGLVSLKMTYYSIPSSRIVGSRNPASLLSCVNVYLAETKHNLQFKLSFQISDEMQCGLT